MNLFDKIIDSFSMQDLRRRVWIVVGFGIALIAATIVLGCVFLPVIHTCGIEGSAEWDSADPSVLNMTFKPEENKRLRPDTPMSVEIKTPDGGVMKFEVSIHDIEPSAGIVKAFVEDGKPLEKTTGRFNVRLIILEKPFYKLLWGS